MPFAVLFIPINRNARKKWQKAYREFRARRAAGLDPLAERELLRSVRRRSYSWPRRLWLRLAYVFWDVGHYLIALSHRLVGRR
jgi:hypothetical protein